MLAPILQPVDGAALQISLGDLGHVERGLGPLLLRFWKKLARVLAWKTTWFFDMSKVNYPFLYFFSVGNLKPNLKYFFKPKFKPIFFQLNRVPAIPLGHPTTRPASFRTSNCRYGWSFCGPGRDRLAEGLGSLELLLWGHCPSQYSQIRLMDHRIMGRSHFSWLL